MSTERQQAIVAYNRFHQPRFDYVMALLEQRFPDPALRVLDIGRSALSDRLLARYVSVTTLGLAPEHDRLAAGAPPTPERAFAGHIVFDLNDCRITTAIPHAGSFDLIVFCEVVEHLHTAPERVLLALDRMLAPGGAIVCQTPNAVALDKRVKMMLGRNPYERLRAHDDDVGHIREYTESELVGFAAAAGLEVVFHAYADYFHHDGAARRPVAWAAINTLSALVPSFRQGQTIIYRKPVRRT